VVFLGPSLPLDTARAILPAAIYKGPAEQSDVVTAVEAYRAKLIGLIDGTFRQSLSVWHSEICYALSRGVRVYGSSSMGALRAAETRAYGTVGVGQVFRWYVDGTITRDDEVALAHGDAASGYQKASEPLVNIRATLDRAVTESGLDPVLRGQVIEATSSLFFPDRTLPAILQRCRDMGLAPRAVAEVERILKTEYVDVKREDARELLLRIREDLEHESLVGEAFVFSRPYVFETLYNHDRRVVHGGREVPLQFIAEHLALHSPDFEEIKRSALNVALVLFLGVLLDVRVTDAELAAEQAIFRERHGLSAHEDLARWLLENDQNEAEFAQFCRESALCRKLQRWILANRGFDRGTRYVLDELKRRGSYELWACQAAEASMCAQAYADAPEYESLERDPDGLAAAHAAATGVRLQGDVRVWAEEAGFEGAEGLLEALKRAAIFRDVQRRIDCQLERLGRLDPGSLEQQVGDGVSDPGGPGPTARP
jgi:hypothetical protein